MVGGYHRGLDALFETYRLTDIVNCVGPLDYCETISLTRGCDVLLIVEGDYGKGYFLPSKLIDYVQVGKPILAISPKKGTVSDIIRKYGGGVLADGTSAESVSDALALLFKHWEKGSLQQTFGSHKLLRLFSADTIVGHYERIVEKFPRRCSEDGLWDRN
jgi:glycosyltransferase involved in cell wall biosynthesis